MAELIDIPEEVTVDEQEVITDIAEELQAQSPETPVEPVAEPVDNSTEVPDKYKDKSVQELVEMHQNAERALGKQGGEVGELRKLVDDYITTQATP